MKATKIHEHRGAKTYALVFDTGDEVVAGLNAFAREKGIGAAQLSAIGAFSDAVLGYFDWETKEYARIPVREQVEVVSLLGGVALDADEPKAHAHVVVGRSDGMTRGGHLLEAHVRPTLEVILVESPRHLHKRIDRESGLALIRPELASPLNPNMRGGGIMAMHREDERRLARRDKEAKEAELIRKLPEDVDAAQERGERIATGKAIATAGKEGHGPVPRDPDGREETD